MVRLGGEIKPSVVSGIIVLALAGYFGYHNAYVRPHHERERIAQQLREAQQAQDQRVQVAAALAALEHKRQRLAPRPEPDWLLQEVGRLAHAAGIEVQSLAPQQTPGLGELSPLAVSVQFSSTYHQLGRFLNQIERAQRFIQVDEVRFTRERGQTPRALAHVVLSTFYVPPSTTEVGGR